MIKCKQLVNDISKDIDGKLSKKMSYRIHLFMCKHCRNYLKQLNFIKSKIIQENQSIEIDSERLSKLEHNILEKINCNKFV